MGTVLTTRSQVAVKKETVRGVYQAPTGDDIIAVIEDTTSLEFSRDKKDRLVQTGSRAQQDFRLGMRNAVGSLTTEMKAGSVEGALPEYAPLFESFGFRTTYGNLAEVTSLIDHEVDKIYIDALDVASFSANDIIMVKAAGAYHVTPIGAPVVAGDDYYLPLVFEMDVAPADGVKIAKSRVLFLDPSVNTTVSITEIFEGGMTEDRLIGGRTESIEMSTFAAGELPQWVYSIQGLKFDQVMNETSLVPATDTSAPPLIEKACIRKNDVKTTASELTLSLSQTVSFLTSACADNNKYDSRGSGKYAITGTINPYKADDAINFKLDESVYSIFASAGNPKVVDSAIVEGEMVEVVAIYLPTVKSSVRANLSREGVYADQVTFEAISQSEKDLVRIAFF